MLVALLGSLILLQIDVGVFVRKFSIYTRCHPFFKKVESKLGSDDQLLNDAHLRHACVAPAIERTYKNLKMI